MLDETSEGSQPFIDLLLRYRDTELPAYREKIARARREAERQFKEHFVARMNEYINDARESFAEINHTLKEISFGEDQYSFSIRERPEKRQILEVFRTAMKVEEYKDTLFESLTSEEEKQSIEALFKEILTNDLDSPRVREICDYRTYFTYDIRIRHMHSIDKSTGRPHESNLSKVLREKSGGEAQTPYYVALGASFFRFFKEEEGAIRLALFDEAFNKMDDTRIGTALTFFRRLGMQVVTAVPTEKIETIAPYSDQVNLIFRHNYRAYAREFAQDSPREEVPSSL
ncbi:MAG: SbcC/MukB-like Walker B domain-containing protein [Spirochaetia bacterium]|nr:SbcC/MukB-like Walker B domain-containing protein [Spirochaetia bacterium]